MPPRAIVWVLLYNPVIIKCSSDTWMCFAYDGPSVKEIHWPPLDSFTKDYKCGALMFLSVVFPSDAITLMRRHCNDKTLVWLQWPHNGRDGGSNHQPHHCLLNRLFRHISKSTSKLRVTGLCVGNSPVTVDFPAQMASNAENVSIW